VENPAIPKAMVVGETPKVAKSKKDVIPPVCLMALRLPNPVLEKMLFSVKLKRVTDTGDGSSTYCLSPRVFKTLQCMLDLVEDSVLEFLVLDEFDFGDEHVVQVNVSFVPHRRRSSNSQDAGLMRIVDAARFCTPWERDEDILWEHMYKTYQFLYLKRPGVSSDRRDWFPLEDVMSGASIETMQAIGDGLDHIREVVKRRLLYVFGSKEAFNRDINKLRRAFLSPSDNCVIRAMKFKVDTAVLHEILTSIRETFFQVCFLADMHHPMVQFFHIPKLPFGTRFTIRERYQGDVKGRKLYGEITENGCDVKASFDAPKCMHRIHRNELMFLEFLLCCGCDRHIEHSLVWMHAKPVDVYMATHLLLFYDPRAETVDGLPKDASFILDKRLIFDKMMVRRA